jgi:hypothetical protein
VAGDRPRGHTSLTGAVDVQISVQKGADGTIIIAVELMKDGPEGAMLRCRLVPAELGVDSRGKLITSCVVEHLGEAEQNSSERKKPRRLPAAQTRALTLLQDAIARHGETPPADNHIPPNTPCIKEELWRQSCYQGGISTGGQEAKRAAFTRAADSLIGYGVVGSWAEWVWPVKQ